MQPQRRQPTRLPRPWDSPRKNTGVGCHFLLQCMKVKKEVCHILLICPFKFIFLLYPASSPRRLALYITHHWAHLSSGFWPMTSSSRRMEIRVRLGYYSPSFYLWGHFRVAVPLHHNTISISFLSCHNKWPHTWWLKTTWIYALSYGCQKSNIKVKSALLLSGGSQRTSVPRFCPNFWWLLEILGVP